MILYKSTYNLLAITAPKIHTDLLWDLSFLFIGLSVIYFSLVFIHKKRLKARLEKIKLRKNELAPMISEFLFYEDDASKEDKTHYLNLKVEIRDLIKNSFNRKVLSDVLLDLRKDLSGDTQKRLFGLYQDLDLHKDAFKKLKSWRWEVVSKAIQDLTKMQVSEAYGFITKFINDKRSTIRKQAEIATVTLKYEGINYFLDSTKYKISEWQQLKLLDVIRNQKDYNPPSFSAWLTSSNNHVVLFALRLIKFYHQNNANASLVELLKHKNSNIKLEAIACIKEFHVQEAMDTLKLIFWKSSTDLKIAILDAIGDLGIEDDIAFLELIDKKVSNFAVKSKAISAINAISPERMLPTKDIVDASRNIIPDDLPMEIETVQDDISEGDTEEKTVSEDRNSDISNKQEKLKSKPEVEPDVTVFDAPKLSVKPEEALEMQKEEREQQIPKTVEDIAIEYEEVLVEIDIERTEKQEPATVSTVNLDFLPIVMSKSTGVEEKIYQDFKTDLSVVNELVVSYEVERSHEQDNSEPINEFKEDELAYSHHQLTIEDIAFLPIVVENNSLAEESVNNSSKSQRSDALSITVLFEEVSASSDKYLAANLNMNTFERYNTPEILALKTTYEEVAVPHSKPEDILNFEVIDPVFLSVLVKEMKDEPMNVQFNTNTTKTKTDVEMTPQDEARFKKIINSIIHLESKEHNEDHNHTSKESSLTPSDNDIDITFIPIVEEVRNKEPNPSEDVPNNEESKVISSTKLKIPNAIISDQIVDTPYFIEDNSEESTMQLLDDLDEMGDEREIPLLNEMLVNVKYKTVSARIEKLIQRFKIVEEKVSPIIKSTKDIQLKPFNVFEDLFRVCDPESKLILLDEVAIVGDVGDISFLEDLLDDENKLIREKSEQVLIELKTNLGLSSEEKLDAMRENKSQTFKPVSKNVKDAQVYTSLMEELEIETTQPSSGLFDVAFDLEFSDDLQENSKNQPKKPNQDSIMNQICSFSSKIINKFNG